MQTPLVSTTTTKQAFSAMKLVKTRLHNRIEDKLLADNIYSSLYRKGNCKQFHYRDGNGWVSFYERS